VITADRYRAIVRAWGLTRCNGTIYVGSENQFVNVPEPDGKLDLRLALLRIARTQGFDASIIDQDDRAGT